MTWLPIMVGVLGVLEAIVPFLVRKNFVFGITIPEPFVKDETLKKYKVQYSCSVFAISVALVVILLVLASSDMTENKLAMLSFTSIYIVFIVPFMLYILFHYKTKRHKQFSKWSEQIVEVHSTDLSIREKSSVVSSTFFTVPIVLTLALIAFTYMSYDQIPDVFASHWNAKGEVDGWSEKSRLSVIFLPIVLLGMQLMFWGMAAGINASKVQLSAQDKKKSVQREIAQRKYGLLFLVAMNYSVTILYSVLQYTTIIQQEESLSAFNFTFIAFMVITFVGLLFFIWKVSKHNEQFESIKSNETAVNDDQYWKWGVVYYNSNDPSLFVQKKHGVGWTINIGNKWSYVILLLPILPMILLYFI